MKIRDNLEITAAITAIANFKAEHSFTEEGIQNIPLTDRKKNGLGIALAKYTDYDGKELMEILGYALEDANYHNEAATIRTMLEKM